MTSTELAMISPLASPLPPPPENDSLSEDQWKTLYAIGDTLIAPLSDTPGEQDELVVPKDEYEAVIEEIKANTTLKNKDASAKAYLRESASDLVDARHQVHRILTQYTRKDARDGLLVLLSTLK